MEGIDRVLRSRRQGQSRFISEEEEDRLRRNVEERRKIAGRGRGYQGQVRKDRAAERQESTGEEEGSMRNRDSERTERVGGYSWRRNGKERERRLEQERLGEREGAGGKDRERGEGNSGRETVEGHEEMQACTQGFRAEGRGGNEEGNGRIDEEEERSRSGVRQEEEVSEGEKEDEVDRKLKDISERVRKGT